MDDDFLIGGSVPVHVDRLAPDGSPSAGWLMIRTDPRRGLVRLTLRFPGERPQQLMLPIEGALDTALRLIGSVGRLKRARPLS
jgi:hypothetical protein